MAARPRPPLTPCPRYSIPCCWLATGRPRGRSRPPCPIAYGRSSFRTWLRYPREQGTDLGLPVPAVAAEGTDRRQLAGLCPACDRLGIHPEHGRYLCRREQRLGLGRACGHMYGLSSWTGTAILRGCYLAPPGACRGCPIWPTETILPSPAVTSRPPGAKILWHIALIYSGDDLTLCNNSDTNCRDPRAWRRPPRRRSAGMFQRGQHLPAPRHPAEHRGRHLQLPAGERPDRGGYLGHRLVSAERSVVEQVDQAAVVEFH